MKIRLLNAGLCACALLLRIAHLFFPSRLWPATTVTWFSKYLYNKLMVQLKSKMKMKKGKKSISVLQSKLLKQMCNNQLQTGAGAQGRCKGGS